MAKLSSLTNGQDVYMNVNGVHVKFKKIASNYYGKGEVILLVDVDACIGKLSRGIFQAPTGTGSTISNLSSGILPTGAYAGTYMDHLLNEVLPTLLDEEIAGSLVDVPIPIYTPDPSFIWEVHTSASSNYYRKHITDSTFFASKSSNDWRYLLGAWDAGTLAGKVTIPMTTINVNRRCFLFSVTELGGARSFTTNRSYPTTLSTSKPARWSAGTTVTYAATTKASISWLASNYSTLRAQGATGILDESGSSADYNYQKRLEGSAKLQRSWGLRGCVYISGPVESVNNGNAEIDAVYVDGIVLKQVLNSTKDSFTYAINQTSPLDGTFADREEDQNGMGALVNTPIVNSAWAGLTIDGNCEVVNSGGKVTITKGTAVKTYRKLNGIWYRTI